MTPDLCIYHANCMDGFTAAWVVQRRFPGVVLMPAGYGDSLPTDQHVNGQHILVVDFSYTHDRLVELGQKAASVTVLDHHKTAAANLEPFEVGPLDCAMPMPEGVAVRAHFDMEKSGARLAWEYCFPAQHVPAIVRYTEDRDLWRWRLPDSRAINAALGSHSQDIDEWDRLEGEAEIAIGLGPSPLALEGHAILRQRDKDLDAIIDAAWRWMKIGGIRVPVVNAPFFLASDIGERLSEGNPFAATYYDNAKGERIFSLRSQQPEGADVAEIARKYGGGGHKHAAGFQAAAGWEGDPS